MILLDTHVFVWLFHEPIRLTEPVLDTLEQTDVWNVATISLWEIAMLFQKRRLQLKSPLPVWLKKTCAHPKIRLLPITPSIAVRVSTLEMHGDPADRLIVATAIEHDLTLLTADHRITDRNIVSTVW